VSKDQQHPAQPDQDPQALQEEIRRLETQVAVMRGRIRECDQCEINLAETNARLEAFLNSAHELVCFLDGEGRILSASQTFLDMYRLNSAAVRGRTSRELAEISEFHRQAFNRAERWERKAWETGTSVTCEDIVQSAEEGDRLFEVTRTPLFYEDGEPKGMVMVGMDVTERVKREFEAQRLMAEQAAIFENALVGIIFVRDAAIARVNHTLETMFGYDRDELRGRPLPALVSEKVHRQLLDKAGPAMERGEACSAEVRPPRKDGRLFYARFTGRAIDPGDPRAGFLWLVDDIDEQKRVQRLREDTERLMRHDLKAPLQGILGAADLLLERPLDETCRRYVDLINSSGAQILETIENSLDLFRMEEGLYQLTPQPVNLLRLLRKIAAEFEASLRTKNLDLAIRMEGQPAPEDGCLVRGEQRHLENLFSNLIKNAVEASPKNQTVTVSLQEGEQFARTAIHHMGAIPDELHGRFFERYATSGKEHGTGLGAYSARLIARVHGGDIDFTSSDEEGTRLVVALPRG
jgi:PAS domain S-box-containing protein